MVTLIDIMLLGHWLEMRSVRQASGALNELAKLMPDTPDRIGRGRQQSKQVAVGNTARGRSGAGAARREHPGRRRGGRRALGRQRGDDHRRVEAGRQKTRAAR